MRVTQVFISSFHWLSLQKCSYWVELCALEVKDINVLTASCMHNIHPEYSYTNYFTI